jgi:hypothetical protein
MVSTNVHTINNMLTKAYPPPTAVLRSWNDNAKIAHKILSCYFFKKSIQHFGIEISIKQKLIAVALHSKTLTVLAHSNTGVEFESH